ncbi:MAG: SRPBCC family protein [Candidatus Melainabacteria bacterium]|nr:SRPBCC family protein [Candidatus Melainabacteria bacterium]
MIKKILLPLGITIVVAVAGILIMAAMKPDTFTYQRSKLIKASRDKIYDQVIDFHNWTKWSPYEHKDPNMKRTYSGAESGVGSKYAWEGNDEVGKGNMEITQAKKPTSISMGLHFTEPFQGDNQVVFSMVPQGEQTEVTWSMSGTNPFMCKVMGMFLDVEKMCNDDFDKGLTNLKNYIERGETSDPKASKEEAKTEPEIREAQPESTSKE